MSRKAELFRAAAIFVGSFALTAAPGAAQEVDQKPPAPGTTQAAPAANSSLDVVIVTAQRRAEDIQDVPLSVSAINGDSLERKGVANVLELTRTMPSLSLVGANSSRSATLQIRGVGSSGLNPGIEPDVGVYFDGVYQKQAATVLQSNLLDLEAIEVLRGPQGTLYGRNTPVGAVVLRSRAPSAKPEAMLQVGAGSLDTQYVMGYAGGEIAPDLAARVSAFTSQTSGSDLNLADNARVNGSNQAGARLRARWTPSDTFTGDLIAFYNRAENFCCVGDNVDPTGPRGIATPAFIAATQAATGRPYLNLRAKDHRVDSAEFPLERVENFGMSATGDWALGDLSLTSITAYNGTRIATPRGASQMQPVVGITSTSSNPIDSVSQEFRLASPTDRRLTYQAGVYLFHESIAFRETRATANPNRVFADGTMLPPGLQNNFRFSQRTFSASAYGQATWSATDTLRFTAGARVSYDDKSGSASQAATPGAPANFTSSFPAYNAPDLSYNETKPTGSVSVQYDVAPTVMVYTTVSTGWKSGGFNGRAAPAGAPLVFGPENAKNYEVGLKSTFFDRRLQANLSAYRLDVSGFQDSILNPATGSGFIVGNAGDIRAQGVEADLEARPISDLILTASVAYLDSAFSNYSAAPCYTGAVTNGSKPGTCDLNGRTPAFSPTWRGSLGAEYTHGITDDYQAFLRADVSYSGAQFVYAALDPDSRQPSYTLVNARVGLESPDQHWRVSLWAKNLTDETYYTAIAPVSNGGFLSGGGRAGVGSLIGWTGARSVYGLEASVKF